ncbi:MAG: Maf family protein [Planctomycetota bacterium]|jgi:septum formation protein
MTLVLASTSPRRRLLLTEAGIDHRVVHVPVDESLPVGLPPEEAVRDLAERKARAALTEVAEGQILAADTAVVLDGTLLGKPRSREEAREMLRRLSAREHRVMTGVCLVDAAVGQSRTRVVTSRVRFRELSEAEIEEYVETGEPLDKAGAYGIQGAAGAFVVGLVGPLDNVVGLPVEEVREMLLEVG